MMNSTSFNADDNKNVNASFAAPSSLYDVRVESAPEKKDTTSRTDSGSDIESGEPIKDKANRTKPFIILIASVAALGGLIFGYDIA